MALGKAYFELVPKMDKNATTDIKTALSSIKTDGISADLGKKLGAGLIKSFAALGIGKAIADTITKSVAAYADYEQLVGGVETLFKDSADVVQEYARQAYKTQGLSANSYMETVTSFSAAMINALGGDTAEAARVSNMAITDMADNANKMGTSMEEVQRAYQSMARGNFGMLDSLKLGYGGTRAEMERMLADAEKLTGIKYDISNFADIANAIHAIQTEMGITGTTAKEAATTLQGSLAAVKASWENVLVALADPSADFSAVFAEMVGSTETLLQNAIPVIGEIATQLIIQLPDAVVQLAPVLVEAVVQMILNVGEKFKEGFDNIMTDFGNWVAGLVNGTDEAANDVVASTAQGIDGAVAEVQRLPSETDAALANLDYSDSGYAVGHSFAQGILGRIGEVSNASMQLALAASAPLPHSPAKIGPFSGRGWTLYSGESVADAFAEGFTRRMAAVQAQIVSGMGSLAATINGNTVTNNISMSVTADSTTTLDNLVAQARRARALNGGY